MTDSRVLAMEFGQRHQYTIELIRNHIKEIERFGVVRFETLKPKTGRPMNIAVLTEEQALILLTFTRSRQETNDLRHKLISEFSIMKKALQKQEVIRLAGIEVRKSLTDTLQDTGEQERMHGHGYSTYTKMVYEVTGLKDQYQVFHKECPNGDFRTVITPDELSRVKLAESLIKPLLELDKQYSEIKDTLKPLFEQKAIKKAKE